MQSYQQPNGVRSYRVAWSVGVSATRGSRCASLSAEGESLLELAAGTANLGAEVCGFNDAVPLVEDFAVLRCAVDAKHGVVPVEKGFRKFLLTTRTRL